MSRLELRSPLLGKRYQLNCTSFSTTLFSKMSSAQTKTMQQHFPVKAEQPEVTFDIWFTSEDEFEDFQRFVRRHQLAALHASPNPEVALWWPERDITDWTGIIKNFRAGGARFNPAPKARLTVDLIDSVYSRGTGTSSIGASIWGVAGYGSQSGILQLPDIGFLDGIPGIGNVIGSLFG